MDYPQETMHWATVATAGATSWIHSDTEGLGTTTRLLTGSKLWVMFYRDPSLPPGDPRGDLGSISFAPPVAQYQNHMLEGYMTAEAVILHPTDTLSVSVIIARLSWY
jgi:hypothetical protein